MTSSCPFPIQNKIPDGLFVKGVLTITAEKSDKRLITKHSGDTRYECTCTFKKSANGCCCAKKGDESFSFFRRPQSYLSRRAGNELFSVVNSITATTTVKTEHCDVCFENDLTTTNDACGSTADQVLGRAARRATMR